MKHIFILFAVFLMPLLCFAQKEDYVWVMGYNIIDFNTTPPTVRENGDFTPESGLTSICDKNGNLVYWSKGIHLYNKNNEEIFTSKVFSGFHQLNSITLFPFPGSETNYILMHLDYNNHIIKFTVIDGSEDVLQPTFKDFGSIPYNRNTPIIVQQENSRDFWIINMNEYELVFNVYSLTSDGLQLNSTYNYDGENFDSYLIGIEGYWVSNNQSNIVAYMLGREEDLLYLNYSFDNVCGKITDITVYHEGTEILWPCAFSKNDKYLFFVASDFTDGTTAVLYRCPVDKLKEKDALKKYRELVYYPPLDYYLSVSIKLGPDGNIYFINDSNPEYISVIYNPEDDNPIINSNGLKLAQPNQNNKWVAMFPYTYHYPFGLSYTRDCHDFTFSFSESEYESIVWNFGDGTEEVRDVEKPTHTFADDGKYTVSLTVTLTDGIVREYSTDVEITTPKAPRFIVEE